MRVPTRRADKLPRQKPDPYLTEEKFIALKNKLDRLKNFVRPKEAVEVRRLAEMGDFSENAGYQLAKSRLRGINQRIIDIENHLKSAVIIKTDPKIKTVQIGSRVILEREGKEKVYTILGSSESNPIKNIISYGSPLGEALLGRDIGEEIRLTLNNKEIKYRVKSIK